MQRSGLSEDHSWGISHAQGQHTRSSGHGRGKDHAPWVACKGEAWEGLGLDQV